MMVAECYTGIHCTGRRGEPCGMYMISLKMDSRLSCFRTVDGFIRASDGNWRPSSVGGGDNFVHVENLAAKLETGTDPLMVFPNVALRQGKTDHYMGFEYSGESRVFLSVVFAGCSAVPAPSCDSPARHPTGSWGLIVCLLPAAS